jgi:hypothetical protein
MMLPKKRVRERSGIERAPKREWPRHRKFVRSHGCCVPGCQDYPIEFHHLRSAANSGVSQKPHDAFGVSLCAAHHVEYHQRGGESFERKYSIDLAMLAAEFVRRSPDRVMKESLEPGKPNPQREEGRDAGR